MDLIFTSKYYSSYQSSKERCFYIDFGHKLIKISFCQLLSLRYKAKKLSSGEHLEYMLQHYDTTLLTFCDKEHVLLLDVLQVLDFAELIQGTFAMIELNEVLTV